MLRSSKVKLSAASEEPEMEEVKLEDKMLFPIYVIRDFRNATRSYEIKIFNTLFSLGICMARYYETDENTDYFWVWLIGFIFWSCVEFALAVKGVRQGQITTGSVFGVKIGTAGAAILRGASEGSAITIFGLGVGDAVYERKVSGYAILAAVLQIIYLVLTYRLRKEKKEVEGVTSRRPLFVRRSVVVLGSMTIYTVVYAIVLADKEELERLLLLLAFLSLWAYLWHFTAYVSNVRWFEKPAKHIGGWEVQAIGMTFDSVIEIGVAYTFFLAVYFHLKPHLH